MSDIRDNLERAIELVQTHPEDRFDLSMYIQQTLCGTHYCTAGLLTTDQHFRDLGLEMRPGSAIVRHGLLLPVKQWDEILGTDAYRRLLATRGSAIWDADILDDGDLTDKELALARLNRQLEEYPYEEE